MINSNDSSLIVCKFMMKMLLILESIELVFKSFFMM